MKKLIYSIFILSLALAACSNENKKQELALQQQVLNIHEKVMSDNEQAMITKMKLDTMIQKAVTLKTDSAELKTLREKLNHADSAMSEWMSKFDPNYSGKSHDDIVNYLKDQQNKVKQVDSMLINATKEADQYILKNKKQ